MKFKIKGMHCQSCATLIKDALLDAGVTKADVVVGSASVEFDKKKMNETMIKAIIQKAGYEVG